MNTHDLDGEAVGFKAGPAEVKVTWTKPVLVEMSVMEGTAATQPKGSEVSESTTTKNSS